MFSTLLHDNNLIFIDASPLLPANFSKWNPVQNLFYGTYTLASLLVVLFALQIQLAIQSWLEIMSTHSLISTLTGNDAIEYIIAVCGI